MRIKNTGTTTTNFWVGLSFAGPDAQVWPTNWYDVFPKQTTKLAPGDEDTVQFSFDVPPWLRPGQYYAVTAVWADYDRFHHKMLPLGSPYDSKDQLSFTLPPFAFSQTTLMDQVLAQTRRFKTWNGIEGTLWDRYDRKEKILLYFEVFKYDIAIKGVTVPVGGYVLVDLADFFGITPEGQEGWVTVWLDGTVSSSYAELGIPVGFGLTTHDFSDPKRGDKRTGFASGAVLDAAIPGINFRALSWDSADGKQLFNLSFDWDFQVYISIVTARAGGTLTAVEIKRDVLGSVFDNAVVPGLGLIETVARIRDAFNGIADEFVRFPATEDDGNWKPNRPTNISPTDNETNVSLSPLLTASPYSDEDSDSHSASRWQVGTNSTFTSPRIDTVAAAGVSYVIPSGQLVNATKYYWRVAYKDARNAWSDWSAHTAFTTLPPPPTRIIRLEGNLAFGEVQVNASAQRTLTIYNDGNSPLTVSGISYPNAVFTGNWSGDIPAGGSTNVTMTFKPTATQSYSGNLTVNANHTSGPNTRAISGTGVQPPTITTTCPLPAGTVGVAYNQTLSATGGKTPYTWSISDGTLPPGLSLNPGTGLVSGTPTTAGTFNFTIRCTGANTLYSEKPCSMTINAGPPTIATTCPLPGGTVGVPFSTTLQAMYGATPYTWSLASGSLPAGLTLAANTGIISGTPTAATTNNFTLRVTGANGLSSNKVCSLAIIAEAIPPTIAITEPSAQFYWATNAAIRLEGKASDNVGVVSVTWANNRGGSGNASGTTNWIISSVNLLMGTNVLTITARDAANNSASVSLVVVRGNCGFSLSATSAVHPPDYSQGAVYVAATFDSCAWAATSTNDWITITRGATNVGSGFVDYMLPTNTSCNTRTGHLVVAGQLFTVIQNPSAGSFSIAPSSASFGAEGGNGHVLVTGNGGCYWAASSGCSWVRITSGTSGTGTGTVDFVVDPNPGCLPRTCTLTIAGLPFAVSQAAGTPDFVVSPTTLAVGKDGGMVCVNVTAGSGCTWLAAESCDWVTITSGASGSGNGTVCLNVQPLADCAPRSCTLMVAGKSVVLTQSPPAPQPIAGGLFNGLFMRSITSNPAPAHQNSGHFTLKLSKGTAFSGKLSFEGASHSFRGQLDSLGRTNLVVVRKGKSSLQVELALNPCGNEQLTGTVSDGNWSVPLVADRVVFHRTSNPCPWAGSYTFAISGHTDSLALPGGLGWATLTIGADGKVKVSGKLAEGTALSLSSAVSSEGWSPWYRSLYRKGGSVVGWVKVVSIPASHISGELLWTKPDLGGYGGNYYPSGFASTVTVYGKKYNAPARGERVLGWENGMLYLDQGNLPALMTFPFTLQSNNAVVNQSPATLKLSLNTAKGTFSGSVTPPGERRSIKFAGILVRQDGEGYGYFLGTNQSGSVGLGPRAP